MGKEIGDRVVLKPAACVIMSLANRRNTMTANLRKRSLLRRHGKVVGVIREKGRCYITVRWRGNAGAEKEQTLPAAYLSLQSDRRRR